MPVRRSGVHTLMLATGVIALNLAVGRALWQHDASLLIRVALIGIALQLGLWHLARNPRRPFWVGFVAAGSATMLSCFYILDPMHVVLSTPTVERSVYVYPGSTMFKVWGHWDDVVATLTEPFLLQFQRWFQSCPVVAIAVIQAGDSVFDFLPHLVIAVGAGLVSRFVACRLHPKRRNEVRPGEPLRHAFRFRVLLTLLAVGVVAGLLVLAGRTISEKRRAVADYYGKRERSLRECAEYESNRDRSASYRYEAERYAQARRKYQHAANHPWLTVTLEPSDPE